jgi:hypothetical protein
LGGSNAGVEAVDRRVVQRQIRRIQRTRGGGQVCPGRKWVRHHSPLSVDHGSTRDEFPVNQTVND